MGRGPQIAPTYNAKLQQVRLFQTDLDRYQAAADRKGLCLTEFIRHALDEAAKSVETFFYVKLPNGNFHPPLSEPGYEYFTNARRFAARSNGTVIRAVLDPSAHSGRDLPPD